MAFLDDEGHGEPPPFISTTNARELYGPLLPVDILPALNGGACCAPGQTVADAAARKASENEAEGHP